MCVRCKLLLEDLVCDQTSFNNTPVSNAGRLLTIHTAYWIAIGHNQTDVYFGQY